MVRIATVTKRIPLVVGALLLAADASCAPASESTTAAQYAITDLCGPEANPITCENSRAGTPRFAPTSPGPSFDPYVDAWDIPANVTQKIFAFPTKFSASVGESVDLKVAVANEVDVPLRIGIYRLGYYGGNGARKLAVIDGVSASAQPACNETPVATTANHDPSSADANLFNCSNWSTTASWQIPADAVSGVYLAKIARVDQEAGTADSAAHVLFMVRNEASRSEILFQVPHATYQAYTIGSYGKSPGEGHSLYSYCPSTNPVCPPYTSRAYKVSHQRPQQSEAGTTPVDATTGTFFAYDFALLRYLERNGFDVSYYASEDTDARGDTLLQHKVFLSSGHDEYWSERQVAAVTSARDQGVHLAFFSGNQTFFRVRWEDDHQTLVSYKELTAIREDSTVQLDPNDGPGSPPTTIFRATALDAQFGGYSPENALSGVMTLSINGRSDPMTITAEDGKMRFWRNTAVANLGPGENHTTIAPVVGYEWDADPDNGFRPNGLFSLSTTVADRLTSIFETGPSSPTHRMTYYRAASGAHVFASGTVQLSWALDSFRGTTEDASVKQAVVNMFADMGVAPQTLEAGLQSATATTDVVAPTVSIVGPAAGTTVTTLHTITLSGRATDVGGVVGGVEVSSDEGRTWHSAVGREQWYWRFTPCAAGAQTLYVRAVDDSGNIGPTSSVAIQVNDGPQLDHVRNADFKCGFEAKSDIHGVGQLGKGWTAIANSGTPMALSNSSMLTDLDKRPMNGAQRIVAGGAYDGIYQYIDLVPGARYTMRALVHVGCEGTYPCTGKVVASIGRKNIATDASAETQLEDQGKWKLLTASFVPTQVENMIFIRSDAANTSFKVADVEVQADDNLVKNADVDEAGAWTVTTSSSTGADWSYTTVDDRTVLRLHHGNDPSGFGPQSGTDAAQELDFAFGTTGLGWGNLEAYRIDAWIRAESGKSAEARILMRFPDATTPGRPAKVDYSVPVCAALSVSSEWTHVGCWYVPGAAEVNKRGTLTIRNKSANTDLFVDSVSMRRVTAAEVYGTAVLNASFDEGIVGWLATGANDRKPVVRSTSRVDAVTNTTVAGAVLGYNPGVNAPETVMFNRTYVTTAAAQQNPQYKLAARIRGEGGAAACARLAIKSDADSTPFASQPPQSIAAGATPVSMEVVGTPTSGGRRIEIVVLNCGQSNIVIEGMKLERTR